ncbi:GAF domain-containing protein [Rhodococcus sp. SMB37]|uniref:helix-turn-helix domain-containing protein n=1 Tax=Rhodococcus sp. SMB37 TaxID=2512213 RepID=UPI0006D1C69A|nr:GAF domain-containing protein [Rhodococcus sp. SMB37]TCN49727.1 GAF domain-containing protein [Rhodococcus sp. SMB37]
MNTPSREQPADPSPALAVPTTDEVRRVLRECAEDLTSVRDGGVVLQGILRRTRTLLGVDMAYLSVNDLESGETHIAETVGVETEEYRTIRMPLGTGILGTVAAGNAPTQTRDYLADPDMNHLPGIDAIVRGEGVRSIAGAPVRVGGRVVAALLVAHRVCTAFPDETVAALVDLAAQAGVAYEHLRIRNEASRLRTVLSRTMSSTGRRQHELESLLLLDDRLMAALRGTSTLAGIADVLGEFLGTPVGIADPDGRLVAGSAVAADRRLRGDDARTSVAVSHREQAAVLVAAAGTPLLVMAASAGEEHLATLVAEDGPGRREILSRASVFVSTARLFERTLETSRNREQFEMIELLMDMSGRSETAIASKLESYGFREGEQFDLYVCEGNTGTRQSAAVAAIKSVVAGAPALVAVHTGHICVLRSSDERPGRGRAISDSLRAVGITVLVGSSHASCLGEIRVAHDEARAVVSAMRALGRSGEASDVVGLGLAGAVTGARDERWVDHLIERFLGPIISYDRERRTELCSTAWHYLENGGHLARTAAALHVHVSTVRQRSDRIDTILGDRWRRAPGSLDTHLALRLWRLRTAPNAPGHPGVELPRLQIDRS